MLMMLVDRRRVMLLRNFYMILKTRGMRQTELVFQ